MFSRSYENSYFEELRESRKVLFRFSFTITPWNFKELPKVVKFAKEKKTYVGFRIMHLDRLYRNGLKLEDDFMKKFKPVLKEVGDNYFKKHIGDERSVRCFAFINSVFIDPSGHFHPCLYRSSIGDGELSRLWNGKEGRKIRGEIKNQGAGLIARPSRISLPNSVNSDKFTGQYFSLFLLSHRPCQTL